MVWTSRGHKNLSPDSQTFFLRCADVAQFCHTRKICQIAGKLNKVISPAPLCPVPAYSEPFQHVIIDCVGPLPKTKSGNQFLLTIMYIATRSLAALFPMTWFLGTLFEVP